VARIGAFIGDLDRRAQLLDHDIAAYPVLATTLTARRDNLRATIAALERRLAGLQGRPDKVPD
jgi:ABC-type transporter Mla subunit MlaD